MKATTVVVLLILASASLLSQSVSFAEQLRPFRINTLIVTDLRSVQDPRVEIAGLTVDGREIQLFSTATEALPERLECFLYFDDSVQTVRIEISFSFREPVLFEYPTELNPYQVTVFASSQPPLPPLRGYRLTSSMQLLGPEGGNPRVSGSGDSRHHREAAFPSRHAGRRPTQLAGDFDPPRLPG